MVSSFLTFQASWPGRLVQPSLCPGPISYQAPINGVGPSNLFQISGSSIIGVDDGVCFVLRVLIVLIDRSTICLKIDGVECGPLLGGLGSNPSYRQVAFKFRPPLYEFV